MHTVSAGKRDDLFGRAKEQILEPSGLLKKQKRHDIMNFINPLKGVFAMHLRTNLSDSSFKEYLNIITERQLLDESLWQKCVGVFASGIDNADAGWRGEYWGKMMRGACLVYAVNPSKELLRVLTDAVRGLLAKQDESGRITTYRKDKEFFGWDMWTRKYVMTGLQHFCDICPDEKLKDEIMTALIAHADYIIEHIGEDKINILETGEFWGGVNSASILEPFVRLYKDTQNKKYLDFAEYIISTGGCRDGNLLECATRNIPVFCYPEQKAYETMSFFEGILAYYEVTGEEKYLEVVKNFTYTVLDTDVTVIGSSGCTNELFDYSYLRQTEPNTKIMQETCVTVTLMRLLSRLYRITGDKRLMDTVENSARNALVGALNVNGYEQYCRERKSFLPGMLFDSYSPLCNSRRARGIGGYKEFSDGSYFGCCACIASAGFGLYPLMSVTEYDNGYAVNYLLDGSYSFEKDGNIVTLEVSQEQIKVRSEKAFEGEIKISEGSQSLTIESVCDKKKCTQNGYTVFSGTWNDSDVIDIRQTPVLSKTEVNYKLSLSFAGHVLAADTEKTAIDFMKKKITFLCDENENILYSVLPPEAGESVRLSLKTNLGDLILTDYASAGQDGKSFVSVWF